MSDDYDPLAETDKTPSISWKDVPVGTVQTLDVSEPCGAPIHYKDYDSGEPQYWQAKGSRPSSAVTDRPVQQIVYEGVDGNGEPASLFVKVKGEQLFFKLQAAQTAYGKRIGATDTIDRIAIKLTGRENPETNKKQNQFAVKITTVGPKVVVPAPDALGGDDPWGSAPPADDFSDAPF